MRDSRCCHRIEGEVTTLFYDFSRVYCVYLSVYPVLLCARDNCRFGLPCECECEASLGSDIRCFGRRFNVARGRRPLSESTRSIRLHSTISVHSRQPATPGILQVNTRLAVKHCGGNSHMPSMLSPLRSTSQISFTVPELAQNSHFAQTIWRLQRSCSLLEPQMLTP